ncbi:MULTISPECIES: hypothetical protein [Streptomyces]|nr:MULTISPECIES: hypothetical protein [Streptomyces]
MLCNGSYTLTPLGHDARETLRPVTEWSQRWAAERPAHCRRGCQRNRF